MHSSEPTTTVQMPFEVRVLTPRLLAALRSTMFGSRLTITPRRISQVADELGVAFQGYMIVASDDAIEQLGKRLAEDGLGHSAAVKLVSTLLEFSEDIRPVASEIPRHAARFSMVLLAGYMGAREAYLLREQEITRKALERAREQHELMPEP